MTHELDCDNTEVKPLEIVFFLSVTRFFMIHDESENTTKTSKQNTIRIL